MSSHGGLLADQTTLSSAKLPPKCLHRPDCRRISNEDHSSELRYRTEKNMCKGGRNTGRLDCVGCAGTR